MPDSSEMRPETKPQAIEPNPDQPTEAAQEAVACVDVFISFAPADDKLRARLEVHLGLMKRQGLIRTWDRSQAVPGSESEAETRSRLDAAQMVLLLVSADFLAHDQCYEADMTRALARHGRGEACVIPILVHACDWTNAPFACLTPLPEHGRPVTSWRNRNAGWASVAHGVRTALEQFINPTMPPIPHATSGTSQGVVQPRFPTLSGANALLPPHRRTNPLHVEGHPPFAALLNQRLGYESTIDPGLMGRDSDVMNLLERSSAGHVLIWGCGGVGKTALARRIADELAPHYRGPRIEIDLMGSRAEPLSPIMVMKFVLDALYPREERSEDETIVRSRYLSALEARRPVLILDNAQDGEQVACLLPDHGCLVLITSTRHFTLPDLFTWRLDRLEPGDAIALIQALAPHVDSPTAGEIANLCGNLPLTLRMAACTLAERALASSEYLVLLRTAQTGLDPVVCVVNASLELLDPPLRKLWCRLGVFPADFDDKDVSDVLGLSSKKALLMLPKLALCGLVEWGEGRSVYRLHDLLRAHACSRLAPVKGSAAALRYELWDARTRDDLQGVESALGGLMAMYEAMDPDNLAARDAALIVVYRQQEELARALHDRAGRITALGKLWTMEARLGKPREALDELDRHLASAREIGDREGEARLSGYLGRVYVQLGDLPRAIESMQRYLAFMHEVHDPSATSFDAEVSELRARMLEPTTRAGMHQRRGALQRIRECQAIPVSTPVSSLAVDHEGGLAITCSTDAHADLDVLDLDRGVRRDVLKRHYPWRGGVAMSRYGELATTGLDTWQVASGERLWRIMRQGDTVTMTPDGRLIAVTENQVVHVGCSVLRLNQRILRGVPLDERVRPCFTEDGQRLAVGKDNVVTLWHIPSAEPCGQITVGDGLSALALTADGARLVTAHHTGALSLWDVTHEKKLADLGNDRSAVRDLAITPDGAIAVTGHTNGAIRVWDLRSACEIGDMHHRGAVAAVAISANARVVVAGGEDEAVRVWQLDWHLEPAPPAPWSEQADCLADAFIASHVPLKSDGLTRAGRPTWDDAGLASFQRLLAWSGLGWLSADGVRAELLRRSDAFTGSSG